MPWTTPSLKDVRKLTRDNVSSALSGAAQVANSVLRVMSDAMGALAHLTLLYIDWLALQLLPDTSETEWLDRHGQIWLKNSDGSKGRKAGVFATGTIAVTGTLGTLLPLGTKFIGPQGIEYETVEEVAVSLDAVPVDVRALDAGQAANLEAGQFISVSGAAIPGIDADALVLEMSGGADDETDPELRRRVLKRIQQPPMGGSKTDYEQWALAVPGVTRAWCFPNEMGIGTVTVRFMMDEVRVDNDGFPNDDDIITVTAYMDTVRPVAVKDIFIVSPIPFPIVLSIKNLETDDGATRAAIDSALRTMLANRAKPGQTIWASWVSEAVSVATGEDHHDLIFEDAVMPSPGHMPILGTIAYI